MLIIEEVMNKDIVDVLGSALDSEVDMCSKMSKLFIL